MAKASDREYGNALIRVEDDGDLLHGLGKPEGETVWMSDGDRIERTPEGFYMDARLLLLY